METVGDAYVVVSGCPKLNGLKHTSEIASMALELLSHMVVFRVRHLPDHQLQLRIGINTGKAWDLHAIVDKTVEKQPSYNYHLFRVPKLMLSTPTSPVSTPSML